VDRQPIVLALGLLMGCETVNYRLGVFDGPMGTAVLNPEGTVFEEPVGFVANSRNGIIVPLDLKHGTMLSDQYGAPFLRPRWIATGARRMLGQMAVWSSAEDKVTVFATDMAHEVMIEAPYMTGFDGEPIVPTPRYTKPTFTDLDESGNSATMTDVVLRRGWTTTETWIVEFDGAEWVVYGSRSGRQPLNAKTGEPYRSLEREIEFTIHGKATRGDRFTFRTETGVVEHDLGGVVLALQQIPNQDLLIAAVWDPLVEAGSVVLWDLQLGEERGRFEMPDDAQPWRFAFGESAADLYIADAHQAVVYKTWLNLEYPEQTYWDEIPTDGAIGSIAYVEDRPDPLLVELHEGDADTGIFDDPSVERDYAHLFVAPVGANRVDVYDLETDTWLDVHPQDDSDRGIDLYSPIVGMAATPERVMLQQETNWGTRVQKKVVTVTTFDGSLLMLEGDTGCAANSIQGAHVPIIQGVESISFADMGKESNPYLFKDSATQRRIMTPKCGGVVQTEKWNVVYSEVDGSWETEGSKSGIQETLAYEDERWVSDDGAISFTIMSGTMPATDGDGFMFFTDEGILRIEQAVRAQGLSSEPLELPGEPTVFQYRAGPSAGGWDELDYRAFVLLPITNSDIVLRVRLQAWETEAIWD
jgi:hypothetical protein